MEGQAVSDWEKSLVTCMYWGKFCFSRSACKDSLSQNQEPGKQSGQEGQWLLFLLWVHAWSVQVLFWSQENCQHQWLGMPVCEFHYLQQVRGAQPPTCPTPKYSGAAHLTAAFPDSSGNACVPWQPGGLGIAHFWNACKFKFWTDTFGRQRRTACPEHWQHCAFKLMHSH